VPTSVKIAALPTVATGELLTLQRAAYVTEAQLYDDVRLPALVQTLDELTEELAGSRCIAALAGPRLVGAVRSREQDGVLHVGRLVVAPDVQGSGIGSRLLAAAEQATAAPHATLFTGHLSTANLRLYDRHGYRETRRERVHQGLEFVHLDKQLA
jgi:ribosomal protein S18 acetylase RimI-like enzyme